MAVLRTLVWELLARHRWVFTVSGVAFVLICVICPLLPEWLRVKSMAMSLTMLPCSALPFLIASLSHGYEGRLEARASAFPRRLYTLPVSTPVLVAGPLPAEASAEAEAVVAALDVEHFRYGRDFSVEAEPAVGGWLCRINGIHETYEDVFLPVHGRHQTVNLAVASAAVEALLGRSLDPEAVIDGASVITCPGRLEAVSSRPLILLDGAHNPQGFRTLASSLEEEFAGRRWVLMTAAMQDAVSDLQQRWAPLAARGAVIDLIPEMMRLTLDILMRTLFSLRLDDQYAEIFRALTVVLRDAERRIWSPLSPPRWEKIWWGWRRFRPISCAPSSTPPSRSRRSRSGASRRCRCSAARRSSTSSSRPRPARAYPSSLPRSASPRTR